MPKARVLVTLKPTILDAQGQVIQNALESLGFTNLKRVRMGKYIEITLEADGRDLNQEVRDMCEKLLANPVMEDYSFEIVES
ncbi:MAG: phosphoribosylformylglycinamidine synthase subunit PurS [Armatimonadota bacterium]